MFEKRAETQVPIDDRLARRWSGRAYDAHRPVTGPQLLALLEAARWAPSCYGDQPSRYLVWDRLVDPVHWKRAFACLGEFNQGWAGAAPVLMLSLADTRFNHDDQPNRWGGHDTGAASMSLCVQATVLGLMAHQMGGFDAAKIQQDFGIPGRFTPMAMIAVGYQLAEPDIPPALREREYAPRQRRALGEIAFRGEWGRAIV
ncbi:MAG: nitroreductase family protein [Gammaproteobacteria bacterium]|nr:nitroreductase family protein [Gammaproteobacteria bacterium]